MEILDRIPVEISVEEILTRLHLEGNSKYFDEVKDIVNLAQPIMRPKALYDVKYIELIDKDKVDIGGVRFNSRVLRVNLENVGKVFPYVATSGMEVEEIEIPENDLMGKFILDTVKEIGLRTASKYLYDHIINKYKIDEMSSMNPGSLEDWPISEQIPLFSLLGDVKKLIGVSLTSSFLMIPIKSVSGIYFPTETSFASCQLCPREKCPNRKAKYDPELKEKYMS